MSSIATGLGDLIDRITGSGTTPATPPPGAPYPTIYAFGDSLSDAGNIFAVSRGVVPVSPPYADGRFSNGPVWVQDLATDLGLPVLRPSLGGGTDFAYGGAYTGTIPGHTANPSDLDYQLTQFKIEDARPDAGALYTVWIGANDIRSAVGDSDAAATVDAAVNNEMQFLGGLVADGARNLLVLNVPDLGKTPDAAAHGAAYQAEASQLSAQYDTLLQSDLNSFAAANPDVHLTTLDTYALLDQAVADPGAFGLTNVTTPLWSGNYTDRGSGTLATTDPQAQAGYLFFDSLHPTATTHALIADKAVQALGVAA
jgi:phospholipase/lecithinase/hemolysin